VALPEVAHERVRAQVLAQALPPRAGGSCVLVRKGHRLGQLALCKTIQKAGLPGDIKFVLHIQEGITCIKVQYTGTTLLIFTYLMHRPTPNVSMRGVWIKGENGPLRVWGGQNRRMGNPVISCLQKAHGAILQPMETEKLGGKSRENLERENKKNL